MKYLANGYLRYCLSVLLLVSVLFALPDTASAAAVEECKDDFQKVMMCLDFARGKVATPTKECCTAVQGIKENDPKCLCYIIQQSHTGEEIKNLGIQEAKLLQLPSACQLKNASITNCPKLLGLSPSSPDAAIFSENATSSTPIPAGKSSPSTSEQKGGSAHTNDGHILIGALAFVAVSIFFPAFPTVGSA